MNATPRTTALTETDITAQYREFVGAQSLRQSSLPYTVPGLERFGC